ncbi:MAG TPA: LPS assembly protein LptD [Gammaproteobacteria bacterium]|nr:LPS assembly protein LptD [Gammaproteobacteria bacterium]
MNVSRALVLSAALLASAPLLADTPPGTIGYNQWANCPALPPSTLVTAAPAASSINPPTHVTADQLTGYLHGESLLTGNVLAIQGDKQMIADSMRYNSVAGDTHALGNVHFSSPNILLRGPSADYNFNTASGVFNDAKFFLPQRHGRGTAKILKVLDNNHDLLTDVHYTTCPVGNHDWVLNAPDLKLDQTTNTGVGHNVTVDFFGVPIFWTPYIDFPLSDKRKSGFLAPTFGYSTFTGTDLTTPYYLNLAPNYDATLVPRIITKRGFDMGGEFRYLTNSSQGQLNFSYLPHDRLANRERGLLNFADSTTLWSGWNFNTAYNWVSDNLYFQDLGDSLTTIATTSLERHVQFSYGTRDWNFLTQVQDWQIVDPLIPPGAYPYKRLPQTLFSWQSDPENNGPQYAFNSELVQFQQDGLLGTLRLDFKPSASYTFGNAGYYFTPTAAMRVTEYNLDQNVPLGTQTRLSRVTPIVSLDSGVFLQRDVGDSGDYVQTLEPRVFYLYVPNRDQSQIPLFDTLQPQFSFLQLFTDNRFYGADRQGDANQLSYALTSRLLDASDGSQLLEADIGQIRYFSNRVVQLPGVAPQTNLFSDVVGDINLNINDKWSTSYGQQWSPSTRQTDLASIGLQYHPAFHQVINLAYRYNRSLDLKQTDLSFAWPLSTHWSMVGRWNYDVQNKVTLESFEGFEYDSCCWTFQVVHRRYITQAGTLSATQTGQANSMIFFQLQLKGLTTIGRHLEDFLQNGILGYSDTNQPQ